MFGVLVDVSGSMKRAYALDRSHDANVERTHAILTSIMSIVKQEVIHHKRKESIFACAFGLDHRTETCDLLRLLNFFADSPTDGLIKLANRHGALHVEEWISKQHLSQLEAQILSIALCDDPISSANFFELIRSEVETTVTEPMRIRSFFNTEEKATAYQYALRIIDSFLLDDTIPHAVHGHQELIQLAIMEGARHIKDWIPKHLSQLEARILCKALRENQSSSRELIELIPPNWKINLAKPLNVLGSGVEKVMGQSSLTEESMVRESDAYKHARKIIEAEVINYTIPSMQHPKPRPVQEVSEMLNDTLRLEDSPSTSTSAEFSSSASSSLHDRIQDLLKPIKPYIYGGTPMRKALTHAKEVFEKENAKPAVLFLLSDGMSADGNPRPIAQELHELGVTIVTCFLTADHIDNPKCLYDSDWKFPDQSVRGVLFDMSSSMQNTHTPISYLVDADWELPPSGESRLFLQANSLDVVNEFCKVLVSQLTKSCDAIVNLLHKVPLATYINQENAKFKPDPEEQEGGTCYAYAIAAVFHLAMHRIEGREGGVPKFHEIRKCLIDEYGVEGAYTEEVLEKVCPKYRLHFRKVDETKARQAIHERRPVIAKYALYKEQRTKFNKFYSETPKNILNESDITSAAKINPIGHAVVLVRCDPECLTFMNSWGDKFADGGFFRIKDSDVLNNMTFFDVYWTEEDLTPREKRAYKEKCTKKAKELLQEYPSIKDLKHPCPICKRRSKVGDFLGHILEAECPKCHGKFTPKNEDIMQSLYSQNCEYAQS